MLTFKSRLNYVGLYAEKVNILVCTFIIIIYELQAENIHKKEERERMKNFLFLISYTNNLNVRIISRVFFFFGTRQLFLL